MIGKRIEVAGMMMEFRKRLGKNWDGYRILITQFLIGRLSRTELQHELDQILDTGMVHMHNQFLLANLANALHDPPKSDEGKLTGWNQKRKELSSSSSSRVGAESQLAKLKEDVMGLSVRERKRIKSITRESGKKGYIGSTIVNTRQAMLPHIPFVNDKERAKFGSPIAWTQDIVQSFNIPLATETFELPESDSLKTRMQGIALEHGILGNIDATAPKLLLAGLESYLKDIVQQAYDTVKQRNTENGKTITAEDMAQVFESTPTCTVETSGPMYRLFDVMLEDMDDLPDTYDGLLPIDVQAESILPDRGTPLLNDFMLDNMGSVSDILDGASLASSQQDQLGLDAELNKLLDNLLASS
ncbi:hypothetical protein NADFUDRAFT_48127 [Nadsonia fulvescens var. elongata DSM 6958]|uniref:Transcriptional coactivator HFI1/ADA1 n=1 Tax=Nadsonia fulvescens var. elongata DSM 6958 TaxID=857566 RepID=A0A1E3PE33_9ASCO|nr:hypothetical protein NADFUDRAFT_48127 [Nadsonia fulvescens var. elongata DSM 6958]